MATGEIQKALNIIRALNLTSGQLEKLHYEMEDLISEKQKEEEVNEDKDAEEEPHMTVARENCSNL